MKLNDIKPIEVALKTCKADKVRILHKLIFEKDEERSNRKNLRNFSGFKFNEDSDEFKDKLKSIEQNFSLNELITVSNILCISFEGNKIEIAKRILQNLCNLEMLSQTIESTDLSESETEETNQNNDSSMQQNESEKSYYCENASDYLKMSLNYADIESTLTKFNAESHQNIHDWINEFENVSKLFCLSEIQKFIFAKRSLGGNALLFVKTEQKINSWPKLKQCLIDEFSLEINSANLHDLLRKRKMRDSESVQEYFFKMKELSNNGKIDDAALIHYIINGIQDKHENKIVLYGCKTLIEFKQKLRVYEVIKNDSDKSKSAYDRMKNKNKNEPCYNSFDKNKYENKHNFLDKNKNDFRRSSFDKGKSKYESGNKNVYNSGNISNRLCYNCGSKDHISKFCIHKDKGTKCFKCQSFGHKAFECKNKNSEPEVVTMNIDVEQKLLKRILIGNFSVNALIDTGSQVTLIKNALFRKMNVKELLPTSSVLRGLGNSKIKPIGYLKEKIEIDNFNCNALIYVVPDHIMTTDVIVGLDVLMQGETLIDENGVTVRNKSQCDKEVNFLAVLPINLETVNDVEINIESDIPNILRDKIQSLVLNYLPRKTKTANVELNILVKNNEPVFHQPRRLPFSEKKIVETQVAEWLDKGIIEPSSSEYCSPVVVVKKKDGTPRLCIDYRKLNRIVVKDRFPLPLIEDILDQLQGSRIFSTIDLRNGFFHVNVNKDSRKYTSFVTHEGQYNFLKVPFGLCNSPAVFQRYVNTIFRPLINDGIVLPYLDDIVILSSSLEEGIERLEKVLKLASDYGLDVNFKKSFFLKKRIEFLGHVIEDGRIYPSTLKTKAVLNFPKPTNLKQVQSFLGLSGYFRKFIQNYSLIAKPLSDLLKKDYKFKFGKEERNSFDQLKTLLAEKPVLGIYNPNYETELHCDASLEGYGSILMQKSPVDGNFHPTYFMSRKTTEAEKKYSSYELEALAIIESLKKFRVYLLGIHFKIVTDCSAFEKTMLKRDLSTRVARWALLLQEFNYVIEHRSGTKMVHVDALSRSPIDTFCISVSNVLPKLKLAQNEDSEIKAIKELLKISNYENYCERQGIVYKFVDGKELVVVPESMQTEIIRDAHEKGHVGIKYSEKNVEDYYFIPKLRPKIEKIIANCVHCILVNRKKGKKEGFLHPLQKEDIPLTTYHVDHLGPLESTNKNYKHILVIIDAFTKFVWIYPTKTTTSAETISKLEMQKTVFGNPYQIITDRSTTFTSNEFTDYCSREGIKHHLITTGLPRANGQVERVNQMIISVLSKLSLDNPAQWYKYTNKLQQVLNSTYQRSIDCTPFELLFGTKMKTKDTNNLKELIEAEFQASFEAEREELRKHAKEQIFKVQEENKKTYNLRRKEPKSYKINDLVAIKRTQFGPHLKLKSKYLGPYRITKIKGGNTYDVAKEGCHEGPSFTTTCAEFLKPWN